MPYTVQREPWPRGEPAWPTTTVLRALGDLGGHDPVNGVRGLAVVGVVAGLLALLAFSDLLVP